MTSQSRGRIRAEIKQPCGRCESYGYVYLSGNEWLCEVCLEMGPPVEFDPIGCDVGEAQDALSWERGGPTS